MQKQELPENFLWGGSVSAHQTEGGTASDTGKGKSLYDAMEMRTGCADWNTAIDTYHHYREDARLFKELGLKAYRFTIAWSRVLPDGEGEINEKGLAFYDDFIDTLIENGIEPIICTYHFDLPLALQVKYNGWLSRKTVDAYEKYIRILAERFAGKVKYWIPMNEQNAFVALMLLSEGTKSDSPDFMQSQAQLLHHVTMASAILIKMVKEVNPDCCVGGMVNYTPVYPESCAPDDVMNSILTVNEYSFNTLDIFVHGKYPQRLMKLWEENKIVPQMQPGDLELLQKNTVSFLAFSYYSSMVVNGKIGKVSMGDMLLPFILGQKSKLPDNPYLEETQWGWKIDPVGLRISMNQIYARYHVPIFIFENGIGVKEELNSGLTVEDDYRIDYHREHIRQMKLAILEDGVECMGYLTWAPIDILSSQGEMCKRYGFIYVNRTDKEVLDLKRYKKKSFYWFKRVIASNGADL